MNFNVPVGFKGGSLPGYGPVGHYGPEKPLSGGLDGAESPRSPAPVCPLHLALNDSGLGLALDVLVLAFAHAAAHGASCSANSKCGG